MSVVKIKKHQPMKNFMISIALLVFIFSYGQEVKDSTRLKELMNYHKKISDAMENYNRLSDTDKQDIFTACSVAGPFYDYLVAKQEITMMEADIYNVGLLCDRFKKVEEEAKPETEERETEEDYEDENEQSEGQVLLATVDKGTTVSSGTLMLNKDVPFKRVTDGREGQIKNFLEDKSEKLEIKEAFVHFFNNKATTIFIQAVYHSNGTEEKLTFLNNEYSIPIRAFNFYRPDRKDRTKTNTYELAAKTKGKESIVVAINDVFDYVNNNGFNYSVANTEVTLNTQDESKTRKAIIQRRFFDFFTGVVYSDLLGVNSENSNSLLNAQASLLIPMNQKNSRKWTATRQFLTTANIALNNSFDDESRFIGFTDGDEVNHFDLLRKNNLNARIALDIITYESKGWFLNTSLGFSGAFYRTGFRNTLEAEAGDNITEGQVFSLTYGPYINFEFRPQTNFGADITFSLENFTFNDSQEINGRDFANEILVNDESQDFLFKHNLLGVTANFYWLTDQNKRTGGIYARLAATYHTPTSSIFPQVFVGYATNLTSFVNKFNSDKDKQ
ncbi:hypothetical protein L0P88_15655 [Muricauda sp. SCSIO 64092]|uniref:hypothetical protein n=1 Tax=Allomuricauda sp. SCSIO 64092 TaxID=2908842 RepID=UPI001FF66D7C|nr:hypothetical protein [Muricauda sp. SCSIO 64092]UOY05381.1 hypothetical protein L0P88_15655 [Muricauda sp. SCSIO 64092]